MGKGKKQNKKEGKEEIVLKLSKEIYSQLGYIIKAILWFKEEKEKLRLIIIVDDCSIKFDDYLISWYRTNLRKVVGKSKYANLFIINTVTLSSFWEALINSDPIIINVIRVSDPVIDIGGMISALKVLLLQGKIKITPEAVYASLSRSSSRVNELYLTLNKCLEIIYWGFIDAARALIMTRGKDLPSPEFIPDAFYEEFVKTRIFPSKYYSWLKNISEKTQQLVLGNLKKIDVEFIAEYTKKLEEFVDKAISYIKKWMKEQYK